MESLMRRYSVWITSVLGVGAVVWLLARWNDAPMVQKLPVLYLAVLSVHEIEELKLPGGFVELVAGMTGVEIKNIGAAKFGLLLFTGYATLVPALLSDRVWPVMATLLIGCIELFAHLAAARANPKRFYSPGLVTAACLQFPIAVFGYGYLFANGLVKGIYWLWAALFLLLPLFGLQALIVRSNGQSWSVFITRASRVLLAKKKRRRPEP